MGKRRVSWALHFTHLWLIFFKLQGATTTVHGLPTILSRQKETTAEYFQVLCYFAAKVDVLWCMGRIEAVELPR